jgi:hypothetical protein
VTTISDSRLIVKSDRPARERRMPFTQADPDWAAQACGDAEADRHLDEQALEAEWTDRFNGTIPAGLCQLCGEPSDWLDPVHEPCSECLTAAENATIACQNKTVMGQYRVF